MVLRLNNQWLESEEITHLQNRFKKYNWCNLITTFNGKKMKLHGKIYARYSSNFLLKNKDWLN